MRLTGNGNRCPSFVLCCQAQSVERLSVSRLDHGSSTACGIDKEIRESHIRGKQHGAYGAYGDYDPARALPRFQKERGTDDPGDEETKQYRGNPEWHKHTSFQRKIIAKTAPPPDTAEKRRFFAAPTAAERGADRWLSPWSRERRGTPPAVRPWCAAWSRPGWRQREIRSRPRGKA